MGPVNQVYGLHVRFASLADLFTNISSMSAFGKKRSFKIRVFRQTDSPLTATSGRCVSSEKHQAFLMFCLTQRRSVNRGDVVSST